MRIGGLKGSKVQGFRGSFRDLGSKGFRLWGEGSGFYCLGSGIWGF